MRNEKIKTFINVSLAIEQYIFRQKWHFSLKFHNLKYRFAN